MENIVEGGFSNSRLNAHFMCNSCINVSIDRIVIVGDISAHEEEYFKNLLASDVAYSTISVMTSKFMAQVFNNKIFIDYDKFKADSFSRRNCRVDFNPNNLTNYEKDYFKKTFIKHLKNTSFSRIDIAFDFSHNLSGLFVSFDNPVKRSVIYGKNNEIETLYFGSRNSKRYLRIYDKKKEAYDKKREILNYKDLWRIEFELKKDYVKDINNLDLFCEGISLSYPNIKLEKDIRTRAMLLLLMMHPEEFSNLHRNSKKKYKDLFKKISDFDLTNIIKEIYKKKEYTLKQELLFYTY